MTAYELWEDRPREACGVLGIHTAGVEQFWLGTNEPRGVANMGAAALGELQNRGEYGAGLFVAVTEGEFAGHTFLGYRDKGLVRKVIHDNGATLDQTLPGASIAVGHTRYPTSGNGSPSLQPMERGPNDSRIVFCHNGNVENAIEIAMGYGLSPPFASDTDAIASNLDHIYRDATRGGSLVKASLELFPQLEGGYALVYSDGDRLYGARCPWGLRPLVLGGLPGGGHMLASERPAIDVAGGKFIRDIKPGEIVAIDGKNVDSYMMERQEPVGGICGLEYAYFARPYGVMQGQSVSRARRNMGEILGREHRPNISVVVGVPNSGLYAARGYSKATGIPLEVGIIRNEYETGRTFIQASQAERAAMVGRKLRMDPEVLDGEDAGIVDDTVIRGTNLKELGRLARAAGARSVHFLVAAPPVGWPCFFGIDIGNPDELLAQKYEDTVAMAAACDVDSLNYVSEPGFREAIGPAVGQICTSCMTSNYFMKVPERAHRRKPGR